MNEAILRRGRGKLPEIAFLCAERFPEDLADDHEEEFTWFGTAYQLQELRNSLVGRQGTEQ